MPFGSWVSSMFWDSLFWGFVIIKWWGTAFAAWSWWWLLFPFFPWLFRAVTALHLL